MLRGAVCCEFQARLSAGPQSLAVKPTVPTQISRDHICAGRMGTYPQHKIRMSRKRVMKERVGEGGRFVHS
ncbi:hypothetical protein GCM10023086_67960 [Streptomyces venetus]|uniref:Uncharacterized protein n=1 Tax=Streptomyces venetus TaxID=1701086 RepID=A0ABP8H7J0_9ACTN